MTTHPFPPPLFLLAIALAAPSPAPAAASDWQDVNGTAFRSEPVEVIGPLALFRNSRTSGRRVLLRGLKPEDCVRFWTETRKRPARAMDWAAAGGEISADLLGKVTRVAGGKLVSWKADGHPEPEMFVLFFGSHNGGDAWRIAGSLQKPYRRMQSAFPGRAETVFLGVRHNGVEHAKIATATGMPWLVADPARQSELRCFERFAPGEGELLVAITRDGVPLAASRGENAQAIGRFLDEVNAFLWATDPSNPRTWKDRRHFLDAIRPTAFADSASGPEPIGFPLRADGLRQRNVTAVDARFEVGADGRPSSVSIAPDRGVPGPLIAAIAEALQKQMHFSPAIDHGKPVAGSFDLHFAIPATDPLSPAERSWLQSDGCREMKLERWLVLKPVPVPSQLFTEVKSVDETGLNVLAPIEVTPGGVSRKAQSNAFNSDWFGDAGAAAVAPVAGDAVTIDEKPYKWRELRSADGHVDLQSFERRDYCIGYAWTEIEAPQELDAFLGIGSDDGLKIWLNGRLIHNKWIRRISHLDDDIVPLRLSPGKNRLLLKIQNATGEWSFVYRLRVRTP